MMDRRQFMGAAALGVAAGCAPAGAGAAPIARARIEAVCFDGFAIFDPRPIGAIAEEMFPGNGAALMALWRTRQFEYSWLRTLTASYVDFWQVTRDALEYSCAALGLVLAAAGHARLMQAHLQLPPWPDVPATLRRLRAAGIRMALLSNFTARMLDANVRGAGLGEFFEARLSTDAVAAFKPDPRSYQMGVARFALPRRAIGFVAFGGWDAAGASRFGFPTYWINRLAQPAERLGAVANCVAPALDSLPAFVSAA